MDTRPGAFPGAARNLGRRCARALAALAFALAIPGAASGEEEPPNAAPRELERRQPVIPQTEPPTALFSINGALRSGFQWIVHSEGAKGAAFGLGSLDLNFILRPTDYARVFVDVEGLVGRGPDQRLGSLSRLNADADRLQRRDNDVIVREAWLRLAFLDERIRFSVGKLDVAHYFDRNFFAEDDARQFLDAALVNNPMLRPPPNGPGAAIRVSVDDWRYAFGVHAPDDVDGDLSGLPFIIGELGHRNIFPLRGHYRLWARVGSVPDARDRVTWGTGISIDQLVTRDVGLFLRAGLSRSGAEDLTSHAWSAGLQVTPSWLDRDKDRLGIGYGFQHETAGREEVVEAYYTLLVDDWLSLTANVQWILSGPNLVTGGANRNAVVPGLRMLILF